MSKFYLFTGAFCILLLCVENLSAKDKTIKVLTLEEMFELADQNSNQLQLSKSGIEAAYNATQVAKNARLPSIHMSLSFSYLGDGTIIDRDFGETSRAPMPHFGNSFSLEASQTIFAGGAIMNRISKSELQEEIAGLSYDKDRMDIRFLLIGYYLDIYKLINQREVYIKNIEQTNLLIDQIKAKYNEGMALNNDITRHELNLQNYELALIEIDNNRDILNHHLISVLGIPANTVIKPDTTILRMILTNILSTDLIKTAEKSLPELKTAEVNLKIADKDIQLAKADYLPSLAINAANNLSGPITIEIPTIDKNFNYWYMGIGLNYNLSSLFKSNKNVKLAKAQQLTARRAKDVIREQTERMIYSDVTRYKESFEKLNTFEKSLELANENYRIINNRYTNDLVLITEMLDAATTKLHAELQVVNAKINIIYNYYKLKRSIGQL